jgi:hypothetical protein
MRHTNVTVLESEKPFSLKGFCFPKFISPSIHKGETIQVHRFFPASGKTITSLQVNLEDAKSECASDLTDAQKIYSVNHDRFPYRQTENQWWGYCLAPHNYLSLGNGQIQVGLNFFNRFLHIDFNSRSARLVDPEIGNAMLSTTNWFDQKTGELWFASWPPEGTVRRILNPRENVRVTIWKLSIHKQNIERVWQGDFADSLHQLSLSPDRRFLILTELGLWPEEAVCARLQDQTLPGATQKREDGLIPSKILILDLITGEEWRLPMIAAGHVEFDPIDQNICYLSGHNIGLIGVKVGIFGPGVIKKIRLTKTGPESAGEFSHPHFHRITTHIVFRHRGKTLIGVSGYPNKVFLIDTATMTLYKIIEMEQGEDVDTSKSPHICQQDSYGIAVSEDGESVLAAGTGFIQVAVIEEGKFSLKKEIDDYGSNSCFTGHLGLFD